MSDTASKNNQPCPIHPNINIELGLRTSVDPKTNYDITTPNILLIYICSGSIVAVYVLTERM